MSLTWQAASACPSAKVVDEESVDSLESRMMGEESGASEFALLQCATFYSLAGGAEAWKAKGMAMRALQMKPDFHQVREPRPRPSSPRPPMSPPPAPISTRALSRQQASPLASFVSPLSPLFHPALSPLLPLISVPSLTSHPSPPSSPLSPPSPRSPLRRARCWGGSS